MWFSIRIASITTIVNFSALLYILVIAEVRPDMGTLLVFMLFGFEEITYIMFSNLASFENDLVSIERCQSFDGVPPEKGYALYLKNRAVLKQKNKEKKPTGPTWPSRGKIEFTDLKVRYR